MIAERTPRVRHVGLQLHGASQGCDRFFAAAVRAERDAEQHHRDGMVRNGFENLVRLFHRRRRIGLASRRCV